MDIQSTKSREHCCTLYAVQPEVVHFESRSTVQSRQPFAWARSSADARATSDIVSLFGNWGTTTGEHEKVGKQNEEVKERGG